MKNLIKNLGVTNVDYRQMANGVRTRSCQEKKAQVKEIQASNQTPVHIENYQPPKIQTSQILPLQPKQHMKELISNFMGTSGENLDYDLLATIYETTHQKGGMVNVLSIGLFEQIVRNALEAKPLQEEKENMSEFIEFFQNILFTYEFLQRNPTLKEIKLYKVGLINFVQKDQLKQVLKDKQESLKYFNYDLTLFQDGAQAMNFKNEIFNSEYMAKHYGNEKIDIRIQNPCDYGFIPYKLKNKCFSMLLKDYRYYQINYEDPEKMKVFPHVGQLKNGQIFFGVNFEPSDNMLNTEVKKCCNDTFLDFYADFDLLSYLDHNIPGCSIPQMYFKAPGCWTGGHQENVAMSALNINHGPDYSEWFTLDLKYVEKLREELITQFNMDLYTCEGLWYQDLDWFIERGYPVKRFLQRKNDIVVTGPGTLHWVRSFGTALQTSWNMFPKTFEQFEAAFHRQEKNKELKFRKSDIIPLKSLIIKYLNHEKATIPINIRRLCTDKLRMWFEEEKETLSKSRFQIRTRRRQYLGDSDTFCQRCYQEILVYYLPPINEKKRGVLCIECFKEENKPRAEISVLYKKIEEKAIDQLLRLCECKTIQNTAEIKQLCFGQHIGKTPCKKTEEELKMEEEYSPENNNNDAKTTKLLEGLLLKMEKSQHEIAKMYEKMNSMEKILLSLAEKKTQENDWEPKKKDRKKKKRDSENDDDEQQKVKIDRSREKLKKRARKGDEEEG